jgi:hypothetical protein
MQQQILCCATDDRQKSKGKDGSKGKGNSSHACGVAATRGGETGIRRIEVAEKQCGSGDPHDSRSGDRRSGGISEQILGCGKGDRQKDKEKEKGRGRGKDKGKSKGRGRGKDKGKSKGRGRGKASAEAKAKPVAPGPLR